MKEGWTYKKLGEVCNIEYGTRVVQKRDGGTIYPVYGGGGATFKMDTYNRENRLVIGRFAMSAKCTRFVDGKFFLNDSGLTVSPKNDIELLQSFLDYIILANNDNIYSLGKGSAQRNLCMDEFREIIINYPKDTTLQQNIVKKIVKQFARLDQLKANAEKELAEAKGLFQKALEEYLSPKEGWEEKKLGEVGHTQTGTTPSKSNADNYGDYMPFVRPAELNIDNCGTIEYNSEIKLSKKGVFASRLIPANSILMCCIGSVGKTGFSTKEVTCNQQINTLTPKSDFCSKYFYYALISPSFQRTIIKIAESAQSTLAIINKTKWENISIPLPPLSEQRAIVEKLDAISERVHKLEDNCKTIATYCDDMKQQILKETFE